VGTGNELLTAVRVNDDVAELGELPAPPFAVRVTCSCWYTCEPVGVEGLENGCPDATNPFATWRQAVSLV
jgi:hypothetical protein